MRIALLAIALVACGQIAPSDAPDAASDAQDAPFHCDPHAPFGAPVPLTEINTPDFEGEFRLTPDELTGVFLHVTNQQSFIVVTSRASRGAPFGAQTSLAAVTNGSPGGSGEPSISGDALTLYYPYATQDANGVEVLTRTTTHDDFGAPTAVGFACGPALLPMLPFCDTFVNPSGQRAYVATDQALYQETWNGTRFDLGSNVNPPNARILSFPVVSADELVLVIESYDSSSPQATPLKTATRASIADPFGPLTPLDGLDGYLPSWISPDLCRLYLTSSDFDIYVASRAPK